MSQCVPSCDFEHPQQPYSLDYEVAELTWENGQPSLHGLGLPRAADKQASVWDNPRHSSTAGDTLESVVNQAAARRHKSSAGNEMVPWYELSHKLQQEAAAAADVPAMNSSHHARAFMDALVPCSDKNNGRKNQNSSGTKERRRSAAHAPGPSTCMAGSCSAPPPTPVNLGLSGSVGGGMLGGGRGRDRHCRHAATVEGSEYVGRGGFTSEISPEDTFSGSREYTRTSGDDSVCHSMSKKEMGDVKKRSLGKSSVSNKRSRAAAIHNQSERRRRDKINQRMKTLQKMVPNSSKTDKASMLDEVIDYLKQLQAQVYMMSTTNMMLQPPFLQSLQMPGGMNPMMVPPGLGLGMGMGPPIMDFGAIARATGSGNAVPHAIQPNAGFMPWDNSDALSAFLACQTMQPMNMDTYSRLASALYQQLHQPPPSGSKE